MKTWMVLLLAMVVTGIAGFRASRLPHIQRNVPTWTFPLLWIAIAGVLAVLPIIWWLDI